MTPTARFWNKVRLTAGCWLWSASLHPKGYGQFNAGTCRKDAKMVRAHRFAWELAYGPIPDGMLVCHRCDTPACVRPDHLFLGSPAANSADMVSKGRQGARGMLRGERSPSARLSDEDVRQIRILAALGVRQNWIASAFGINRNYVYDLKTSRARAS